MDELLAKTDPFDLAQAIDGYVRTLAPARIHELVHAALPHMRLVLRRRILATGNNKRCRLTACRVCAGPQEQPASRPLFGSGFAEAVLGRVPSEGLAIDEERSGNAPRRATAAVVVLALGAAAAAGGHYVASARSGPALATPMPPPIVSVVPPVRRAVQVRVRRAGPTATPVPATRAPLPAAPAAAAVAVRPHPRAQPTALPSARGEAVVVIVPRPQIKRHPVQTAQIDTSDMPDAYSDATPLPQETAQPLDVPRVVTVGTPKAEPKRRTGCAAPCCTWTRSNPIRRKGTMKYTLWSALVLIAALAACSSGAPGPVTGPTPGPTCSPPATTTAYSLVYPAPNATGVPDQFGQVVIAASPSPFPSSWNVVVTTPLSPSGVSGGDFVAAATPFPQPTATPSFANPSYQSSSFGSVNFPGEVVRVFLNDTASNCTPLGPIGQFTTQ